MIAGGKVSGFNEKKWTSVQKVAIGDVLLCYITGVKRFVGALEVTSKPYKDHAPIWSQTDFPCRVNVKPIIQLDPETGVPIYDLLKDLTIFDQASSYSLSWTGHLRSSPANWKEQDGKTIIQALQTAKSNPVQRPIASQKIKNRPQVFDTQAGVVTVPESETTEDSISIIESDSVESSSSL